MRGFLIAVALLSSALVRSHAQEISSAAYVQSSSSEPDHGEDGMFEPTQKNIAGSRHYFSNDTGLQVNLPRGFNVNGSYSFYKSDSSSKTATISLGLGKGWDEGFLNLSYSWTPLANGYRSHAWEASGALYTPSKDFRTTIGGTYNVTYNAQFLTGPPPKNVVSVVDIRQMTGTLNLKQRIYDTKLTLDFGKSSYDHEIARLASRINPNSTRLQGLAGLLQGFPDWEWKLGVYRDIGDDFTLWTTYDHIRLLVAAQSAHGNSDSYMLGTDWYPTSRITITFQYNYVVQTGQPVSDLYGLSVGLKL